MSVDNCILEVQKVLGRKLKGGEEEALRADFEKIDAQEGVGASDQAKQKLVERLATDRVIAAKVQARNAVLNQVARARMVDYALTTWAQRPGLALEAQLVGVTRGGMQGSRASVINSQAVTFNKHAMGMIADMGDNWQLFVSGAMDMDILKAAHQLDAETPNFKGIAPEAVEMARAIKKHSESLRVLANQYGANIGKLDGWLHKHTHDSSKIFKNEADWRATIERSINWERSFPDVDVNDADAVKEVIDGLWLSMSTGVHRATSGTGTDGMRSITAPENKFVGAANIGKKMSHERVLHFKTPEDEFEYFKKYGAGKMTESIIYGMEKMSQDIGILQHLGPNAQANLEAAAKVIDGRLRKEGDAKKLVKFDKDFKRAMKIFWPHVSGLARVPGNHMLADVSMTLRAIQQMSKLGGAVMSAFSDVPYYASEVRYGGGSMLSGMGEAFASLGNTVPPQDRAKLFSALGVVHDGLISAASKRFDPSADARGHVGSAVSMFFKFNGLRWWTDQLRVGFAQARSHALAMDAGKVWDEVSPDQQRVLGIYGIDSDKWDIIRQTPEEVDGKAYLTPEGVEELGDEAFLPYLNSRGIKPTPARIRNLRQEIADQFRSYFHDRSTTAVLEPDAKTQGYLYGPTQAGTVSGEIMRHIMLFKSFTATSMHKILGREIYGRGDMTLKAALTSGNGAVQGVAQLLVWSTLFGYLSISAKDLAKGRSPRDPDDPKTWTAAMLQGGAMGFYGDFLFGDMKNRYGGSALSSLLGPTAGTVDSLIDLAQRARDGDDTAAQSLRFVMSNMPFQNIIATRTALDYLFLHRISESINPGYLKRMEKRIMEDNAQTFVLPPSQLEYSVF
jgi:hypothetical protein